MGAADAITAALDARDSSYCMDVGPRCVQHIIVLRAPPLMRLLLLLPGPHHPCCPGRARLLPPAARRKVTISEFKGTWYVSVREHNEKVRLCSSCGGVPVHAHAPPACACNACAHAASQDGKWLPGQKGLSMTAQQWALLRAGMDGLTQALG